jgi:hypothetical protein
MINREQLRVYLECKNDVTIEQIFRDLNLAIDDLNNVEVYLGQLIGEGWIAKKFCKEHRVYEFYPGENQKVSCSNQEI